jgi:hypothetical protein
MCLDTPHACLHADSLLRALTSARPPASPSDPQGQGQVQGQVQVLVNTDLLTELVFGLSQQDTTIAAGAAAAAGVGAEGQGAEGEEERCPDPDPFWQLDTRSVGLLLDSALTLLRCVAGKRREEGGVCLFVCLDVCMCCMLLHVVTWVGGCV